MQVPSIHALGTNKKKLVKRLKEVASSLEYACHMLKLAIPKKIDYCFAGKDAFERAVAEHADRLQRVDDVWCEIDYLLMEIENIKPNKNSSSTNFDKKENN